jgi:hypothetical protein
MPSLEGKRSAVVFLRSDHQRMSTYLIHATIKGGAGCNGLYRSQIGGPRGLGEGCLKGGVCRSSRGQSYQIEEASQPVVYGHDEYQIVVQIQ